MEPNSEILRIKSQFNLTKTFTYRIKFKPILKELTSYSNWTFILLNLPYSN